MGTAGSSRRAQTARNGPRIAHNGEAPHCTCDACETILEATADYCERRQRRAYLLRHDLMTGAEVLDLAEHDKACPADFVLTTNGKHWKHCRASNFHAKLCEMHESEKSELRAQAATSCAFTYRPGSWRVSPIEVCADNVKDLLERLVADCCSIPYADALTLGLINRTCPSQSLTGFPTASIFHDTGDDDVAAPHRSTRKQPTQPCNIQSRRISLNLPPQSVSGTSSRRKRIASLGGDCLRTNRAGSTFDIGRDPASDKDTMVVLTTVHQSMLKAQIDHITNRCRSACQKLNHFSEVRMVGDIIGASCIETPELIQAVRQLQQFKKKLHFVRGVLTISSLRGRATEAMRLEALEQVRKAADLRAKEWERQQQQLLQQQEQEQPSAIAAYDGTSRGESDAAATHKGASSRNVPPSVITDSSLMQRHRKSWNMRARSSTCGDSYELSDENKQTSPVHGVRVTSPSSSASRGTSQPPLAAFSRVLRSAQFDGPGGGGTSGGLGRKRGLSMTDPPLQQPSGLTQAMRQYQVGGAGGTNQATVLAQTHRAMPVRHSATHRRSLSELARTSDDSKPRARGLSRGGDAAMLAALRRVSMQDAAHSGGGVGGGADNGVLLEGSAEDSSRCQSLEQGGEQAPSEADIRAKLNLLKLTPGRLTSCWHVEGDDSSKDATAEREADEGGEACKSAVGGVVGNVVTSADEESKLHSPSPGRSVRSGTWGHFTGNSVSNNNYGFGARFASLSPALSPGNESPFGSIAPLARTSRVEDMKSTAGPPTVATKNKNWNGNGSFCAKSDLLMMLSPLSGADGTGTGTTGANQESGFVENEGAPLWQHSWQTGTPTF